MKGDAKPSIEFEMWKGALVPAVSVGVLGIIGFGFTRGRAGVIGSLLANFIVVIFFAIHLAISKVSAKMDPMLTMMLAMFSYLAKMLILGTFLLLVVKRIAPETLDRVSFGVVAIAITFAWLAGEIRTFLKLRLTLPMPKK
jgi:hypothetical protein